MLYPGSPIKSLIIECIAAKTFATAKDMLVAVNSCLSKRITHQALYKNLRSLVDNSVLVKHNCYYTFHLDYLNKLRAFSCSLNAEVNELHSCHNLMTSLEHRGKAQVDCQNLQSAHVIAQRFLSAMVYDEGGNTELYRFLYHYGAIFFEDERDFMSDLCSACSVHNYVYGKTDIDKYTYNMAKDTAVSFHLVENLSEDSFNEYVACGEYILTAKLSPQKILKYTQLHIEKNIDYFKSSEFFYYYKYQHMPITVTIEKNAEKAATLVAQMKALN